MTKNSEKKISLDTAKPYHKNPRVISRQQVSDLRQWMEELGDLSGIVHDLNSNEIISGNQRSRVMNIKDSSVILTESFDKPTRTGTVAIGYVVHKGEKFNYRQVRWTVDQCEKANIIANKAGGTFDMEILANQFDQTKLLEWGFQAFEFGIMNDLLPVTQEEQDIADKAQADKDDMVMFQIMIRKENRDTIFDKIADVKKRNASHDNEAALMFIVNQYKTKK